MASNSPLMEYFVQFTYLTKQQLDILSIIYQQELKFQDIVKLII